MKLQYLFLTPVPRRLVKIAALLLACAGQAAAQSVDPTQAYRTIESPHFRVTFTPALEPLATDAARIAENAYAQITTQVGPAPGGRIDLLLSDASDVTNGFAMAVPSNRITVFVNPPVEDVGLQNFRDWLDLVITHELAHVFHMDATGKLGRFVRGVFGRVPLGWPVFPVASMPNWATEGLAVEIESLSGSGRLHGSYHDMIVRTAVLEDALDPIDRVSHDSPRWPDGQRVYVYGSLFLDYVSRKHGAAARAAIVRKTGGSILPPELALNRIGKQATGKSFTELWRDWTAELDRTYRPRFDSLRAIGLTRTEPVTGAGRFTRHPRVSPDGRYLAIAEETGREVAFTRVIDLESTATVWTQRRTGIEPASWLPDGRAIVTSQIQFDGRYRLFADLYTHSDNGEERLTRAMRVQDPDVNRAGDRIVAVQNDAGATRLVLLSPRGNSLRRAAMPRDSLRAITPYNRNVHWSQPRWSPDGTRIAVARWENGNTDVVVIDTTGQLQLRLSEDAAIDASPAWSPDGRYVLFWSDRTGIPNLFAVDVTHASQTAASQTAASQTAASQAAASQTAALQLLQVTNVLTGVYDPDVSPDARHIYFSAYHADGFYIERIAYDPSSWRPVPITTAAARTLASDDSAQQVRSARETNADSPTVSAPHAYNPLHTLRPYYWLPLVYDVEFAGTFLGASTSGRDLLGRHNYSLALAVDPASGRSSGNVGYAFSRFGNTTLGVSASRDWDYMGRFRAPRPTNDTSIVNAIEREDIAQATALYSHRRMRYAASVTVGAEIVRRRRLVADSGHIRFANPSDKLWGPIARIAFANTRTPAHAISPENGVALQLAGRFRNDLDSDTDRGYAELTTWNTAYQAINFGGFAHHNLAVRFSALLRDGNGASPADIGGAPGAPLDIGVDVIGSDAGLLPVRGFDEGDRYGNRAWSASLEYRIPIAFPARGVGTWPLFLDRVSAAVFTDVGNASCTADVAQLFVCPTGAALASIGTELVADIAIGFVPPIRARFGVAAPFSGPRTGARAYVAFGQAF